jgi:hypothetical protein
VIHNDLSCHCEYSFEFALINKGAMAEFPKSS